MLRAGVKLGRNRLEETNDMEIESYDNSPAMCVDSGFTNEGPAKIELLSESELIPCSKRSTVCVFPIGSEISQ